MKSILTLLAMVTLCSFSHETSNALSNVNSSQLNVRQIPDLNKPKKKVRFALRHEAVINPQNGQPSCTCTDCVCPGCPCPLGICACFVIEATEAAQGGNDMGIAWMSFNNNGQLILEFTQETAISNNSIMPNPFVPVSGNVTFSQSICNYWGVSSITIPSGNYELNNSSEFSFGKIVVNAIIQN
jgi:hypothetical protein